MRVSPGVLFGHGVVTNHRRREPGGDHAGPGPCVSFTSTVKARLSARGWWLSRPCDVPTGAMSDSVSICPRVIGRDSTRPASALLAEALIRD